MMSPPSRRSISSPIKSRSESRKNDHLRYLEKLNALPFEEQYCEICFCDCYSNSKREIKESLQIDDEEIEPRLQQQQQQKQKQKSANIDSNQNILPAIVQVNNSSKKTTNKRKKKTKTPKKRSKSLNSAQCNKSDDGDGDGDGDSGSGDGVIADTSDCYLRDCRILEDILNTTNPSSQRNLPSDMTASAHANDGDDEQGALPTFELCDSMAILCLSPKVRQAFHTVPMHDKKILNRMAQNRSIQAMANENAWLARKFWENEKYERELMKCEQMEEYKKAIKDKQFQDYLITKARLNELAQRDLNELKQLRDTLREKDERAQKRIDLLRIERDMMQCQRRCDELRKSEAITIAQDEQHIDELKRKTDCCQKLEERFQRADTIRTNLLDNYLKRLRFDNQIEHLMHEENWREVKEIDEVKRDALREHISRKKAKSERFVERKRTHNNEIVRKAKISATLRQLVRSSITPDAAIGIGTGRMIFERPLSNFSIH